MRVESAESTARAMVRAACAEPAVSQRYWRCQWQLRRSSSCVSRREGGAASDGVDDGGVVGLEDTEERVEKTVREFEEAL